MNEVVINADRTTTLDFRLNIAAVEGEEVVVEAKRPIIVKDQTATTTTVESATINNMPVNNITDVLSTMAGVLEQHGGNYIVGGGYHFRGGRAGEITYWWMVLLWRMPFMVIWVWIFHEMQYQKFR